MRPLAITLTVLAGLLTLGWVGFCIAAIWIPYDSDLTSKLAGTSLLLGFLSIPAIGGAIGASFK